MLKRKVRLGIVRKIKTDDFEQLDVICGFEEDVEYEGKEDLDNKVKSLNDDLIEEFKMVYNSAISTLGVDRAIGAAVISGENSNKKKDDIINAKNNDSIGSKSSLDKASDIIEGIDDWDFS